MKLYFVAGEASGDKHGAALMAELRSLDRELQFIGRGGPRMKQIAGADFLDWSAHSAVLGLWEVLKQYGYFRREFRATVDEIRARRPDAVVLIDYPGFNLRLARALRAQLPQTRIIYYISPQVWAWNRGRIPKMARDLDLMLCIFPFEAELYNQSGLRTRFVGHPMIDSLGAIPPENEREPNLIALFPGSRAREVRKILPVMLESAALIKSAKPHVRFELGAASSQIASEAGALVRESGLAIRITSGEAAALMRRASAGMVASGTATLEAALLRMPFVLVYRVAWLTYFAARAVVKVKHLGMPNVLAGRAVVPEFIQHHAKPRAIADAVMRLVDDQAARARMLSEFEHIARSLAQTEASTTAARAILDELTQTAVRTPSLAQPRSTD